MTVCYIGTPVTPLEVLTTLKGRAFFLNYYYRAKWSPGLMRSLASLIGIDCGTYPAWQAGIELTREYWAAYLEWVDPWLDCPTTWAVIPDPIGVGTQELDAHIREWPFGTRGSPVYHLTADLALATSEHERERLVARLLGLLDEWPRVCVDWAEKDLPILSWQHCRAQDIMWNAIEKRHGRRTPDVHHFRGTQLAYKGRWPYARLDGTNVAQNHHRPQNIASVMADRHDAAQCPDRWTQCEPEQIPPDLFGDAA